MKTILVPTDFSKPANNAALYAVHFAEEIKAKILLYHLYDFPIGIAGDVAVPFSTSDMATLLSELSSLRKSCCGINVTCAVMNMKGGFLATRKAPEKGLFSSILLF